MLIKKTLYIILALFLLIGCSKKHLSALEEDIIFHLYASKDSIISVNLHDFTEVKFNQYLVLTPYTNIASLEEKYLMDLTRVSRGIESYDQYFTLAFIKDKNAVGYINIHRTYKILNQDTLYDSKSPLVIKKKVIL